jgi:hypothetical protein
MRPLSTPHAHSQLPDDDDACAVLGLYHITCCGLYCKGGLTPTLLLLPAVWWLQVLPEDKRYMMRCTAGCVMFWHYNCWREFQEGYEQETRDPITGHGINLIQVGGGLYFWAGGWPVFTACIQACAVLCCDQYLHDR